MKNLLFIVGFVIVIISLYSVSASVYTGQISIGVGSSVTFQVGSGLSFNVTNTTNTTGNSNSPSNNGGGGGGASVYSRLSFFSTTNGISNNNTNNTGNSNSTGNNVNLSGNLSTPSNSSYKNYSNPFTGGVINALGSPTTAGIIGVLVVALIATLVVVARRKSNVSVAKAEKKEDKKINK